jgi:hypothetical protein
MENNNRVIMRFICISMCALLFVSPISIRTDDAVYIRHNVVQADVISTSAIATSFVLALLAGIGGTAYNLGNLDANYTLASDQIEGIKQGIVDRINDNIAGFTADGFLSTQDAYQDLQILHEDGGVNGLFEGVLDLTKIDMSAIYYDLNSMINPIYMPSSVPESVRTSLQSWYNRDANYPMAYLYTSNNNVYWSQSYNTFGEYTGFDISALPTSGWVKSTYHDDTWVTNNVNHSLSGYTQTNAVKVFGYLPADGYLREIVNILMYADGSYGITYNSYSSYPATTNGKTAIDTFLSFYGLDYYTGNTITAYSQTAVVEDTFNLSMLDTSALNAGEVAVVGGVPYIPTDVTDYNISNPDYYDNTTVGGIPFALAPTTVYTPTLTNTGDTTTDTGDTTTGDVAGDITSSFASYFAFPAIDINDLITGKLPVIPQLQDGLTTMLDTDTRPWVMYYDIFGKTYEINLDWYEPARLQVRNGLSMLFNLMTMLAIISMVGSLFGINWSYKGARNLFGGGDSK